MRFLGHEGMNEFEMGRTQRVKVVTRASASYARQLTNTFLDRMKVKPVLDLILNKEEKDGLCRSIHFSKCQIFTIVFTDLSCNVLGFCASLEMRGKSFEEIKKILDIPIHDWSITNLKTLKSTTALLQIHQAIKVDEFKKFWSILDSRWTTEDLKIRQKIIMTLQLQGDLVDEIRKIMNDQCPTWSKIGKK